MEMTHRIDASSILQSEFDQSVALPRNGLRRLGVPT